MPGKGSLQAIVHFVAEDILCLLNALITNMPGDSCNQYIRFTFIPAAKRTLYFFWIFHQNGEENVKLNRKLKHLAYKSQVNSVNT